MTTFLLTAVGIYAGLVVLMFLMQRSLMYHPGSALPPPSSTELPRAEPRTTEPEPGLRLTSWYVPPAPDKPVIVYFQGNAATIAERTYKAQPWATLGYGVWLTGYRGYGGNPGAPTEQGLYADARAVLKALSDDGIGPDRVILYGESLGTGIATEMAHALARGGNPARGLVLEAPFISMGRAAQDHYPYVPAVWLVRDKYDNLAKIGDIGTPVFIMHGDRDRVVAQKHGRRLFQAASEPKLAFWVKGGGHSDLYDFGAGLRVHSFFEKLGRP